MVILSREASWKKLRSRSSKLLAVLEKVRKTGKPVLVTRFGQPVAEVVPPPVKQRPIRDLGALRGTARITGDIVSPASDEDDWEVLRS
jgi:antitoxin (DNA-binding transcriptional repressor) of toxin-antitoxin stability system